MSDGSAKPKRFWHRPRGVGRDPLNYWKKPDRAYVREDWLDPEPNVKGMFSADRIRLYVEKAKMIDPFDPDNLKPASYSMTLGPLYQKNGKDGVLTPEQPVLTIPPNSIVFVSMGEAVRLPHYIAARFNLQIDLIYRGLLLGTGPQVDPGFKGVLSCPLHKISNQPIKIRLGGHLATIDFTKTTGLGENSLQLLRHIKAEEELYEASRKQLIKGRDDYPHVLFDQEAKKRRWPEPIVGTPYPSGQLIVESSVAAVADAVKRFRLIGLIGAISIIVALATILMAVQSYYDNVSTRLDRLEEQRRPAPSVSPSITNTPLTNSPGPLGNSSPKVP